MIRARARAGAVLALSMTVTAGACTGGHSKFPSSLLNATTTVPTTFPDFSSVSLAAVSGSATTVAVSLTPGAATISGQVVDDAGAAVAGAVVHIERLVGSQLAAADIAAGPDGTFNAPGVLGGLYRVRAWRSPDLAVVDPDIFFLGENGTQKITLQMQKFSGPQVTSSIAPSPPILGEPANLVVRVTQSTVAADGTVKGTPEPLAPVALVGSGTWAVAGSVNQTTAADGTASWQITCGALGAQPLTLVVDSVNSFPLDLPACAPIPTTTTLGTPVTSSTLPGSGGPPTTFP